MLDARRLPSARMQCFRAPMPNETQEKIGRSRPSIERISRIRLKQAPRVVDKCGPVSDADRRELFSMIHGGRRCSSKRPLRTR